MRPQIKRILLLLASVPVLVFAGFLVAISREVLDSPFDESDFDPPTWFGMAGDMDRDNPLALNSPTLTGEPSTRPSTFHGTPRDGTQRRGTRCG